ncbi:hypothetical protein FOZ63_001337 [Perkinsus olseni]|uniref:Uncharacterized protein n=1 Tax=Perkinsus olseni TaxID=32597 RepID=A0A7J6TQZ6_PEROL|nr:hypothetical protein FOZ60_000809 [Perkinsus olseni]KAF4747779.1 hypothetical protein FOZ62_024570 [Perkinsus olseni]KAF4757942.1 hypothetical protein FOZ63_001337 [Perkinsus olseni]
MSTTRPVRLIYIVAAMLPSTFLCLRSDKSSTQRRESLGNINEAASQLEDPSESPFTSAQAVVEKDAFDIWFEELVYIHGIQRTEDREADLKKLGRMLRNLTRVSGGRLNGEAEAVYIDDIDADYDEYGERGVKFETLKQMLKVYVIYHTSSAIKKTRPHISRVFILTAGKPIGFYADAGFNCEDIDMEVDLCTYEIPRDA